MRYMVLLDGAMGTELQRRGYDTSLPLWSARALIESPEAVLHIHRDYVEAGADVLVTNTFRTHRRNLLAGGAGDRSEELTRLAMSLAREAASERPGVRVAGSVSPLEECYSPDLSPRAEARGEHARMAECLADAGADLLLVETMPALGEALAAVEAARATGLETWVSVVPSGTEPLAMLDGTPLGEAFSRLFAAGPSAVLLNCAAVEVIEVGARVLAEHPERGPVPFGVYANNGSPSADGGWRFDRELPVERFVEHAERVRDLGVGIIGGCCGTTPDHVRALARTVGRPDV